ncbi:MAG: DUF4349 domain-containing protein [Oscillospiraceae bacterium]|nr:DUF4349 domain-containing protein [Oscillospiraceae bacterium]
MKKVVLISLLILTVLNLFACSSSYDKLSANSSAPRYDYGYPDEAEYYYETALMEVKAFDDGSYRTISTDISGGNISDTRKIIKTVYLSLETMEFDDAVQIITDMVKTLGGYIESSNMNGSTIRYESSNERYASYTMRIPSQRLDQYVNDIKAKFNVTSVSEYSSDITDTYYDTEARLKSLLTQEERLLSMLENATELKYMLEVENNLANVRYQIESYHSQLNRYDNQVAMSTVSISLSEVIKYTYIPETPKTFGQQVGNAASASWNNFVDGLQGFIIGLIYALPGLIIFAIFVTVVVLLIIKANRGRKKKIEKMMNQNNQ